MNFLDSNILAYSFYENEHKEKCQKLVSEGGMINTLNLVEAFNIIEHQTSRETATKAIRSLLKSNIQIIEVDINLIFECLKKTKQYKHLEFLDLVHYICALQNDCHMIASYDSDFDNLDLPRII